ncbi:hypothetical protein [Methylobrevis pamukkalensis]|uniref:AsmA-like C-terminal domain-containing protein n=1 Tax=Methylobrevis pamukkalensis TaxID=1439726 RepID=A0A1E3H0X1_9HYPH|nr:hypothetical protein [Methylobrevis pamukkalensis]ODN69785.1 hypothetical protein A6302_02907 [Methylobrevis pamukkalensis]
MLGLSGIAERIPVDKLKQIWPAVIVPNARNWVRDNVVSGMITGATVDLAVSLPGKGKDDAGGSVRQGDTLLLFNFDDLTFRPFPGGPMITRARGSGRLENNAFTVTLESAVVELEDGRTLAAPAGTFVVPRIDVDPQIGTATLDLAGEAAAMFSLWQSLPLSRGIDLGATPQDLSGSGKATVRATMPLIAHLPAEQVDYEASIKVEGLASTRPVFGRALSKASADIRIVAGRVRVTGEAIVDGVNADIDIDRPLTGGDDGATSFRLVLDADARKKLGLDLGDLIKGDVPVEVSAQKDASGAPYQAVTADLSAATIDLGDLGWTKARGTAGKATFRLVERDGGTRIDDFVFTARDARIEGEIRLDANGKPVSADLPVFRLTAGDRLAVTARQSEGRGLQLSVKGARFDARGLIDARLKRGQTGGGGPGFTGDIAMQIGAVTGWGEEEIDGVNVDASITGGRMSSMSLTAQTGGGGATSATLHAEGAVRRLSVEASEMGRLLRFLDYYSRVYGGRATLDAVVDDQGGLSGRLDGQRWKIVDEPALARLATAAPDPDTPGSGTVDLRRLIMDLRFADGRLSIIDGVVRASHAGLSLQGEVDFRRDLLRLTGSYLPAGAFDNLLGKIPILGQTLFAGGRAGLVGVTFRLSGAIDAPELSVNPLSVVAPGVLRKLFELG